MHEKKKEGKNYAAPQSRTRQLNAPHLSPIQKIDRAAIEKNDRSRSISATIEMHLSRAQAEKMRSPSARHEKKTADPLATHERKTGVCGPRA